MTCLHCTAPTTNGLALCKRCLTTAKVALENLVTYHGELLGLGRTAQRSPRRSGAVSDPTGGAVAREIRDEPDSPDVAAAETKTLLVTWFRVLHEQHPAPPTWPADTVQAISHALSRSLPSIATLEWAKEFVRELLAHERRIRRIVERGKPRWYAGICSAELQPERLHDEHSCGCACHHGEACDVPGGCAPEVQVIPAEYCSRDLYAVPGSAFVRCPVCRTEHPVGLRRTILLDEARETQLPLSTIANVCSSLLDDEPSVGRLQRRLQKWTERGQLVWADNDGPLRLYRMGDVLDLLARHAADPRGWSKRQTVG